MNGFFYDYQYDIIPASFYLGNEAGIGHIAGIYFIILTILTPIAFGGLVASFFEGVFAIGDAINKDLYQLTTAAGEAAEAANYIKKNWYK